MPEHRVTVRRAEFGGRDDAAVGRLVGAYLAQTEAEKAAHLGTPLGDDLPERYRAEVDDPGRAYARAAVLLAELDGVAVGVAIIQQDATAREVKRVWVDPAARGHRVGSALLGAALEGEPAGLHLPVRLTVWDWRDTAIRLYRQRGFAPVPSWDPRPRLLCLERPPEK